MGLFTNSLDDTIRYLIGNLEVDLFYGSRKRSPLEKLLEKKQSYTGKLAINLEKMSPQGVRAF